MNSISRNTMPIIAFCEECGARLQLTAEEVSRTPGYIHCPTCSEVIKVAQPKRLLKGLELRLREKIVKMDPDRPILTMGRKQHNDIIIKDPMISRTHATVVYLDGRYTLFDLNLNGTFVLFDSGEEVVLRKNRTGLQESGVIALNKQLPSNPEESIYFGITDD